MEFVIVLGSSNPKTCEERVARAVEYFDTCIPYVDPDTYVEVPTAMLIFCGKGNAESSEAKVMFDHAVKLGVNPDSCIIEDKSMNTHDNIVQTISKLDELGWFKTTVIFRYKFIICTSKFHANRSFIVARHLLYPYGSVRIIHTGGADPQRRQRELVLLDQYVGYLVSQYDPANDDKNTS